MHMSSQSLKWQILHNKTLATRSETKFATLDAVFSKPKPRTCLNNEQELIGLKQSMSFTNPVNPEEEIFLACMVLYVEDFAFWVYIRGWWPFSTVAFTECIGLGCFTRRKPFLIPMCSTYAPSAPCPSADFLKELLILNIFFRHPENTFRESSTLWGE